jgi:hypothetical protein
MARESSLLLFRRSITSNLDTSFVGVTTAVGSRPVEIQSTTNLRSFARQGCVMTVVMR